LRLVAARTQDQTRQQSKQALISQSNLQEVMTNLAETSMISAFILLL